MNRFFSYICTETAPIGLVYGLDKTQHEMQFYLFKTRLSAAAGQSPD